MIIVITSKPFSITDARADFDRACREAYDVILALFKIDPDGYSDKIASMYDFDFIRSTDSIHVKFLGYRCIGSMVGSEHIYTFEGWIEREE